MDKKDGAGEGCLEKRVWSDNGFSPAGLLGQMSYRRCNVQLTPGNVGVRSADLLCSQKSVCNLEWDPILAGPLHPTWD